MKRELRGATIIVATALFLWVLAWTRLVHGAETEECERAALLQLVGALPPWHQDRLEERRSERLETLVDAKLTAAAEATCTGAYERDGCIPTWTGRRDELLLSMVTVSWWESRLARHVHAGQCGPKECDHGLARGVAQVQLASGVPRHLWEGAEGLDPESTLRSMQAAAWVLGRAEHACRKKGGPSQVFGAYGTGKCITAPARAAWFEAKLAEFRRAMRAHGS